MAACMRCGRTLPPRSRACPRCGPPLGRGRYSGRLLPMVLMFLVIVVVLLGASAIFAPPPGP